MVSTPARLDQLAAKVASGSHLTSAEALTLIHSVRQLLRERDQWPRQPITGRLRRTARAGAKASPARWHHVGS
jgi:hypothetical protein